MMTLGEFEAILSANINTAEPRILIALDKVGELAETLAAAYIGHEQPSWAPLAASTIADKKKKGYAVPAPLLREGDMRDSIHKELLPGLNAVVVGSKEKKALWQEMGTSRGIPPRPFLALGMRNAMPYAAELLGKIAVSMFTGKK
jgi:phage gpG-like protein